MSNGQKLKRPKKFGRKYKWPNEILSRKFNMSNYRLAVINSKPKPGSQHHKCIFYTKTKEIELFIKMYEL